MSDLYQELILDHYRAPRNKGRLDPHTHDALGHNPLCGDRIEITAITDGDQVVDVKFEGSGCAISTASASLMTQAVKGKSVSEIQDLFRRFHDAATGEGESTGLGKLDALAGVRQYPARVKCATLAWHTLLAALTGEDEPVKTE